MTGPAQILHRRRIRGAWWALYTAMVIVGVAVTQLGLPYRPAALTAYPLTYFAPIFMCIIGCFALAARVEGTERRLWGLLGLTMAAVAVTEVQWTLYQVLVDYRGPGMPNWFEFGHLTGILVFIFLIVSLTEFGEAPVVTRVRVYLDVIGTMIVLYVAVYWWWTLPVYLRIPRAGWLVGAIIAAYPVAGVVLLTAAALVVLGWKAYRWRTWERLVSLAFALFGVGLLFSPAFDAFMFTATKPSEIAAYSIWIGAAAYLLFMAAVYRYESPPDALRAEPWAAPALQPEWLPMLYPSVLALSMLRVADRAWGGVVVAATATLATVLIVRSWLSSVELAHHRTRSITDAATGTFNQRHLYDRLASELAEAGAAGRTVAAVAFDVVDFRTLVRMSGSEVADAVLKQLTDLIRAESPRGSEVYRVGRDEFLVVLAGCSPEEAVAMARRVKARVASDMPSEEHLIALSVGVAVYPQHALDASALVTRAFASQQLARSAERADVVVFDADVVDSADPLVRLDRARRQSHRTQLKALAAAVDGRDADTRVHSNVLSEVASAFALTLDLPYNQAQILETAALVHDIGKIGIPDDILLKPGQLTVAERALVEAHPVIGEQLLRPADMAEVLPAVRYHHERWDGTGYPDGLVGGEIPFEARVLAICDAFEAMTSRRRFRPALSTAEALAEFERCSGTQFDPELAAMFTKMVVALHGSALSAHIASTRREPNRDAF